MPNIFPFLFVIVIVVFLHELGHYLAARSLGIKVTHFYLFFNPWFSLFKKNINETEYGIGWLPFGGYVKVAGMLDEDVDPSGIDVPRENQFRYQPLWAKIWFLSAGIIMNFLLAALIFSGIYFLNGITELVDKPVISNIKIIKEKSAASKLGLKPGDEIIEIDGKTINTWSDLSSSIRTKPNEIISVKWYHNNQIKTGTVKTDTTTRVFNNKTVLIGILGIQPNEIHYELNFFESLFKGFEQTKILIIELSFGIYSLITGGVALDNLVGPIGIGQTANDFAKLGLSMYFSFIAILSVNLGLLNLLPIPVFDGGQIVIACIESLIGRELSINIRSIVALITWALMIYLMIFIMINDISKL